MSSEPRLCGRPTRHGALCRRLLQWYETACTAHQTAAEAEQTYRTLKAAQSR